MWLTVTSPPQSRMWAQGHWWAVFSLRSVNDVPKIGSNCQNETYKTEDTKCGHKTGQTRESDFHFVWMQLSNLQCLKRNSSFLAPFSVCSFPSASLPIWKPFAGCCALYPLTAILYCSAISPKEGSIYSTFRWARVRSLSRLWLTLNCGTDEYRWWLLKTTDMIRYRRNCNIQFPL